MQIKMVEFKGVDALLILKVGGHELHISYDNGYRFDHECLFISEHLKDGHMLGLAEIDFTAPLEDALLARAERAERMVERLIEAGERLSIHSRMVDDIDVWNALVAEWRSREVRE